mgnify:CR=1 FL=1
MKKIAIFASGSGTNAQRIAEYFKDSKHIEINRIYSNRKQAFVLERADKLNIPTHVFNRESFYHSTEVVDLLRRDRTDLIVLAGFLWLIPHSLLSAFPNRIINVHPALLPKYGGKGMYGAKVHEAVVKSGDKKSGITIHYVNENYDEGQIISQFECDIAQNETPETLAQKIHQLEYRHYPVIIEQILLKS